VLVQDGLIARVRATCHADDRIDAALEYGSFVEGRADAYSDIEFWLFIADGAAVEPRTWIEPIGPVLSVGRNEFGAHVAVFDGLIRGEFHFAPAADIGLVRSWPARSAAVDRMVIVDRRKALAAALLTLRLGVAIPNDPAEIEELCLRYANWLILGLNVARRGEMLRAHDALDHVRRHLLWLARLEAGATQTWLTPSRRAETELPPAAVAAAARSVDREPMAALTASWSWGRDLWAALADRHGFAVPPGLRAALDTALAAHER
jgi:lincosamide nucleotidyltransferase B/F